MLTALYTAVGLLFLVAVFRSRLRIANAFEATAICMFWPIAAVALAGISAYAASRHAA